MSNGAEYSRIKNPYNTAMEDLHNNDIDTSALIDGDALQWNTSTGTWEVVNLNWLIGSVTTTNFIFGEVPSKITLAVFTLANTAESDSQCVYRNGVLQSEGAGKDYVFSAGTTITFQSDTISSDRIVVNYIKA